MSDKKFIAKNGLDNNSKTITNVLDPVNSQDAATKAYVLNNASSLNNVCYETDINITSNYTITTGKNALTAGPITINDGVQITIPDNSTWVIA